MSHGPTSLFALTLLATLAGCDQSQPSPVFGAKLLETELTWPSAVDYVWREKVQGNECFPTAAGPYCVEGDRLVPLSGVLNLVDSASRNSLGDWLIGNYPFVFFSRDGRSHRCGGLRLVNRMWLVDEPGVVVATAEGTHFLSRDECLTWERLWVEHPFGAVQASAGELTAAAAVRALGVFGFIGYRHDLTTGQTTTFPLDGPNRFAAVDDEGFLGLGDGLARYDRSGVQKGERVFVDQEVLAACRHGPVLTATEVRRDEEEGAFECRLRGYGPDGTLWWQGGERVNCRRFEQGAVCTDKTRLFVHVAGVLLEITREGLKPLSAPQTGLRHISAVVDGEAVRLIMGDNGGVATLTEWNPESGWSWLGLGTSKGNYEVDRFAFGPMTLSMRFGAVGKCAGFRVDDAETGREVTTFGQRCIDTGPPQIPNFRQVSAPDPTLLFNNADCQILTLDKHGNAAAFPCNPLGTYIRAGVVVDSAIRGRWLVFPSLQGAGDTLLIEDYGERVVSLGPTGAYIFDENGEPAPIGDVAVTSFVGAPKRLGYVSIGLERTPSGRETFFTRFVPFHGPEHVWHDTEPLAASADGLLLQSRGSLKKVTFEPERLP